MPQPADTLTDVLRVALEDAAAQQDDSAPLSDKARQEIQALLATRPEQEQYARREEAEHYQRVAEVERGKAEGAGFTRWNSRQPVPKGTVVKKWGVVQDPCGDSLTVRLVNGRKVRSLYKTDFIEGGNDQCYAWVPDGEIWVDRDTDPEEIPFIVKHEATERCLMKHKGMSYPDAHRHAAEAEFEARAEHRVEPYAHSVEQYQRERQESSRRRYKPGSVDDKLVASGVVLKAADTGRVLMLQRSFADTNDPAAGKWEFPGGHIEHGESALVAARREWSEEVGRTVPKGAVHVASWTSPNGVYRGFVYTVPGEADVSVNTDPEKRRVLNPDDPDGDDVEVVAWWEPEDAKKNPALREECKAIPWSLIEKADEPEVAKS